MENKIYVLGFDCGFFCSKEPKNLKAHQEDLLGKASLIAGFPLNLKVFFGLKSHSQAKSFVLGQDLVPKTKELAALALSGEKIVVLADGDPLFFGIGETLLKVLEPNLVEIVPAQSCLQLACSRLKIPSHDVCSISFHGQENYLNLVQALVAHKPICLLTDHKTRPETLAAFCHDLGVQDFTFHVLTLLGTSEEEIVHLSIADAARQTFRQTPALCFLTPNLKAKDMGQDLAWQATTSCQSNLAVRSTSLALLNLNKCTCFWDIGAGSGAISFEALRQAPHIQVLAIESNVKRVEHLRKLRQDLSAYGLKIILGLAPDCLEDLPTPEAIFIGGGLSHDSGPKLLASAAKRLALGGRIVVSAVLHKTLNLAEQFFKDLSWPCEIMQVQMSLAKPLGIDWYFVAKNPVYLIWAVKHEKI